MCKYSHIQVPKTKHNGSSMKDGKDTQCQAEKHRVGDNNSSSNSTGNGSDKDSSSSSSDEVDVALAQIEARLVPSKGSLMHPDECIPCRFHCHSFDVVCRYGLDCGFCHCIEEHLSKRGMKKMEQREREARRDRLINSV